MSAKSSEFEIQCIMEGGVLHCTMRGDDREFLFFPMSPERLKVETARDDAICVVILPHLGRVEDTSQRLRAFLERWESREAEGERKRLTMVKAYAPGFEEIAYIHSAACNYVDDPMCKDPVLAVVGRTVIEKLKAGKHNFFDHLSKAAKGFSEDQNFIGGHGDVNKAKGRILQKCHALIYDANGSLPERIKLFESIIYDPDDMSRENMAEGQFDKDCEALGLGGLPGERVSIKGH